MLQMTRPARGTESGVGPDARPRYLAKPGEPVDQLQRPLDSNVALTFQMRSEFRRIQSELGSLIGRIEALSQTRAGAHLNLRHIASGIANARHALRSAMPFAVCPSCAGGGLYDPTSGGACPTCQGAGFISKGGYASLNDDLKRIAEGYRAFSEEDQT